MESNNNQPAIDTEKIHDNTKKFFHNYAEYFKHFLEIVFIIITVWLLKEFYTILYTEGVHDINDWIYTPLTIMLVAIAIMYFALNHKENK